MTEYNKLHSKQEIIGNKYHKWYVDSYSHKHSVSGNWYYNCVCECGSKSVVSATNLRRGTSKQCKSCSSKVNGRKGLYAKSRSDLYVVRCGDFVKIGNSDNVQRRFKDMQTHNPYPLQLLYVGYGEGCDEEMWHNVFKHRHHSGEWFSFKAGVCEI